MKMTNETLEWIEALRSGQYHKTTGCMYRPALGTEPEKYCCLGVAHYAVFGKQFEGHEARRGFGIRIDYDDGFKIDFAHLPLEEKEAMGMTESDESQLASMNDNGWQFDEIADVVEYAAVNDVPVREARERLGSAGLHWRRTGIALRT